MCLHNWEIMSSIKECYDTIEVEIITFHCGKKPFQLKMFWQILNLWYNRKIKGNEEKSK